MANISFKRGVQASLPSVGVDGVFYLTTDSNRLYVGIGQNKAPVLLNQTVQFVDNAEALEAITNPNVNDFYYCVAENILAVYTASKTWKQINPDHNTNNDIYVNGIANMSVTPDTTNKKIGVSFDITRKNKDYITNSESNATAINVAFDITKEDIESIIAHSVGLTASAITGGGATVKTSGNGADTTKLINLKEGANIDISVSGTDITIAAVDNDTTYTFGAANNKLTLSGSNNINDSVDLASGNDAITVTGASDKVTVTHKDYSPTSKTGTALKPAHGGSFTILSGLTTDKGHVTGYTTQSVTLPADNDTTNASATIGADSSGNLSFTIKDSANTTITATGGEGDLYYTVNGQKVYNQGKIDFYTKSEIDTKLRTLDALVYKGTLGGSTDDPTITALPTSGVCAGDTYKVITEGTYAAKPARVGDLFIATGEEYKPGDSGATDTNIGTIKSITWTLVPAGDDIDTKYNLTAAGNKITLNSSVDGETATTVEITQGTSINVSTETGNKIKVSHAGVTCTPATSASSVAHGGTFTALDSITVNTQGHVTGYNTKTYTLPTDNDTTSTLSLTDSTTNDGQVEIKLSESNNTSSQVKVKNDDDYITVTGDTTNNTIKIGHKDYSALAAKQETAATLTHGGTFTAVTSVARDAGGHLSQWKTKTFTLPTDNDTTYSIGEDVSAVSNVATLKANLTASNNVNSDAEFKISTSNLSIAKKTGSTNEITINFEWGTF